MQFIETRDERGPRTSSWVAPCAPPLPIRFSPPCQSKIWRDGRRAVPHPCFQMCDVRQNTPADMPEEMVKIATLHAALPILAQNRVEFAGEKTREVVNPHLARLGHEAGRVSVAAPGRGLKVDLQLDAEELTLRQARGNPRRRAIPAMGTLLDEFAILISWERFFSLRLWPVRRSGGGRA